MKLNAKRVAFTALGLVLAGSSMSAYADGSGYHAKYAAMNMSKQATASPDELPTAFEAWFAALTEEISAVSSSSSSCAVSPSAIPTT